ncbi:hypothetical protein E2320_006407 [Naja naja]|nr:hypothetical protein E2320_006407 [Naja naja]
MKTSQASKCPCPTSVFNLLLFLLFFFFLLLLLLPLFPHLFLLLLPPASPPPPLLLLLLPLLSQHAGVITNHLGNNASSPASESEHQALLDEKEDAYFSEIRNFIANSEMSQSTALAEKREDDDSLTGKSQDETVSPTAEPQGGYEEEEEEEAASLTMSFNRAQRCTDENEAGLLDLEQMSEFGKGLDLRQASEEAFDVKAVYNSTLDSEALKQTLFRQAKNQVGQEVAPNMQIEARYLQLPQKFKHSGHPVAPHFPVFG